MATTARREGAPETPETVEIREEDDIVEFRQRVRAVAQREGFNSFAIAALTTAASELTRNIWSHADQGTASLEVVHDRDRAGIRMVFSDQGPGIPDVEMAMRGGFSTAGTLGLGLSGAKALVDEFRIESEPGKGTTVTVVKWTRRD